MTILTKADYNKRIKSYFLIHPAVIAIEPVVKISNNIITVTSPYFVPGLHITFKFPEADVWLHVEDVITDWMGSYSCSPICIGPNQYISDHMVCPVSERTKYVSACDVFQGESLDYLIRDIQFGKLLQAIEWKVWDDSGFSAAQFDGYRPLIGATDTQWLYPAKHSIASR